jgi:hypothetical protein
MQQIIDQLSAEYVKWTPGGAADKGPVVRNILSSVTAKTDSMMSSVVLC